MADEPQDPTYARWKYEQGRVVAERAFDDETAFFNSVNEAAVNTGSNALKSLILINGGAAIAMLAFIGHLISADKDKFRSLVDLAGPLAWFAWGVACAAAAMGLGYLANFGMSRQSAHKVRSYEHPYLRGSTVSKNWGKAVTVFQVGAVATAFVALVLFVCGIFEVRDVISALPPSPIIPAVTPGVTPQ